MVSKNSITQLHSTTPEELTTKILEGVEKKLQKFKEELGPNTKETYLTRSETAKMLSISLTCLNDWSKKGILPYSKLGNRTYYKLSDIEEKLNKTNTRKWYEV